MRTRADYLYKYLISHVLQVGNQGASRNAPTFSVFEPSLTACTFTELPLVTLKHTAVGKCIKEMEWFLSGETQCPEDLLDWWQDQISEDGNLYAGYSEQFRKQYSQRREEDRMFDQLEFLLRSLKTFPNSRRHMISTWNTGDMEDITDYNNNPKTPASCHGVIIQAHVENEFLHLYTHQRSADLILGVPHNWVQYWAFLLYLAFHSGFMPGKLFWTFGNLHVYNKEDHLSIAKTITETALPNYPNSVILEYNYSGAKDKLNPTIPAFLASDFSFTNPGFQPVVKTRAALL